MGHFLVNAVIHGMKGQELSGTKTSKTGKKKTKKFDANALALLTVIANEQPNPGTHGVDDTICYSAMENLLQLTHMPKATFAETRNFLVNLGLLSYKPSEVHQDVTGKPKKTKYSFVYRVVVPKIRELQAADGPDWKREVLRIDDKSLQKMAAAQRRLLGFNSPNECGLVVHTADTTVHTVDSTVHMVDSAVHVVDTNIKKQNKTEKNTTMVSAFNGADFDALVKEIADACEVDESIIKKDFVRKAVQYKAPMSVDETVAKFYDELLANGYKRWKTPDQRVGLLVKRLSQLPKLSKDELKNAIAAQFTEGKAKPRRGSQDQESLPIGVCRKITDPIEAAFEQLEDNLSIRGLLGSTEVSPYWKMFTDAFGSRDESVRPQLLREYGQAFHNGVAELGGDISVKIPDPKKRMDFAMKFLPARHD